MNPRRTLGFSKINHPHSIAFMKAKIFENLNSVNREVIVFIEERMRNYQFSISQISKKRVVEAEREVKEEEEEEVVEEEEKEGEGNIRSTPSTSST